MTPLDELLPDASGPFTRALARGASDELPIPIRVIMRADASPARFLPFLAADQSVDLWFDDWPDVRKRLMVSEAVRLASLKGSRKAAPEFLAYVDGEIVDKVSYPRRFVLGRAVLGITPANHRPFTTHYLVKVPVKRPANGFVAGRSALRRQAIRAVDREPLRRVFRAFNVSKAPDTAYSVNLGWRRPVTVDDGFPLDGSFRLGGFTDRKRL